MTSIWDYNKTPTSNTGSPPTGFGTGQAPSNVRVMLQDILGEVTEFVISAVVGGTADALTITFTNAPAAPSTLVDGMEVHARAAAANATATPTLAINGGTARTITKLGGTALVAGDIAGNLHEMDLRYNLANTRWELLNPAVVVADATNGGLTVTAAKPTTLALKPSDLLTKATPIAADSIMIMDSAASNAAKTATITAVVAAVGFSKSFTSTGQTITAAGALTLAHGLGVAPTLIQPRLHNVNAELGYNGGDEVIINHSIASTATNRGMSIVPDATNINIRFGSDTNVFAVIRKDTGVEAALQNLANWTLIIKAWA